MKNLKHPNFIIGAISILLFLIGVGIKANGYQLGIYVIIAGVALGGIHWIWSVIDVYKNYPSGSQARMFWLIFVLLIPPLGGIIYYLMGKKQVQI